ncbi:hypothetical protein HY26_08375 [Hyphomonas sp. GM-8P]|nr:hypothetical protein HY26_08375 [Hyphomonas sp. GM-8P]
MRHALPPAIVVVIIFAVGTALTIRHISNHLSKATKQFFEESESLPTIPVDVALPREIESLAILASNLTSKLVAYKHRQEDFSDRAAHELKNSIGILTLSADKLQTDESLLPRKIISLLSKSADRLLLLSSSKTPAPPSQQPLQLDALSRQVIAELAPIAIRDGKSISLKIDAPTPSFGSDLVVSTTLITLISGILSNCEQNTNIRVVVGPGASLKITSDAIMLNLPTVHKLNGDRSSLSMPPGGFAPAWLDLALVAAEAQGGSLIYSTVGCDNSFILTLPEWRSSR